jgi:hypothetical protein
VEIDEELLNWYRDTYPTASVWYAINELFKEFKEAHESNPPINLYRIGAQSLKDKLEKDLARLDN